MKTFAGRPAAGSPTTGELFALGETVGHPGPLNRPDLTLIGRQCLQLGLGVETRSVRVDSSWIEVWKTQTGKHSENNF